MLHDQKVKQEKWQVEELGRAVSRLTANLLRIMAGAGRTIDLERQLDETNKLAKQVFEQSPPLSESTMNQALTINWPWIDPKTDRDREFNAEQHDLASIVQYSLRLAAAKLEGNNSEASKNGSLLWRAIRQYERAQVKR